MPAASRAETGGTPMAMTREAVGAMEALLADATRKLQARVTVAGRTAGQLFDREQRATHGLAWLATYVEAIRQLAAYAERLSA
ncbi:MAG: acyl-CoA dehydrogenase family protein, partial [Xanthobacteraceae bacterium]